LGEERQENYNKYGNVSCQEFVCSYEGYSKVVASYKERDKEIRI
jgi:hypothetical protein